MVDLAGYREALARIPAIGAEESRRLVERLSREIRVAQEEAKRAAVAEAAMNTARAVTSASGAHPSFRPAALFLAGAPRFGVHSLALLGWV
jgi:hypothetical protein